MKVTAYKTPKIKVGDNLTHIIDNCLPELNDKSVVVITSKIISLWQENVVKNNGTINKRDLIRQEADYYLGDDYKLSYGQIISIKNQTLIASAGIDESNGNGYFVLWPEQLQEVTNDIWRYLRSTDQIDNLGVIVTDSHTTPLRWGTTGIGLSWCGFEPLKNYIETPDIFGRYLHATKASIIDGLAAAAVVVMGEGKEQTPLAIIEDVPFVSFQDRVPKKEEIEDFRIQMEDDLYAPLLTSVNWTKTEK